MIARYFTREDDSGDLVRFVDIEPALRDADRYQWLLPCIAGTDDDAGDRRNRALGKHYRAGLRGNKLVDAARAECPK